MFNIRREKRCKGPPCVPIIKVFVDLHNSTIHEVPLERSIAALFTVLYTGIYHSYKKLSCNNADVYSFPKASPPAKEKRIPPPVLGKPDEIIEKRKSWLNNDTKKTESAPSEEVSGLRKEVTDLRALVTSMEKKMAEMERKQEEELKSLEKRLLKDIEQLTSDFDEERTNHARLKIDVDRLKKKMRRNSESIDDDTSHA